MSETGYLTFQERRPRRGRGEISHKLSLTAGVSEAGTGRKGLESLLTDREASGSRDPGMESCLASGVLSRISAETPVCVCVCVCACKAFPGPGGQPVVVPLFLLPITEAGLQAGVWARAAAPGLAWASGATLYPGDAGREETSACWEKALASGGVWG